MLFQNKLSSIAGQHILVDFGRSFPLPLPQAAVATYYLDDMTWIQNRTSGPGPLGNAFIELIYPLVRFSFLSSLMLGIYFNFDTFVEFSFSLYCLFISYLCRYRLHICRLLMALTILIKVCGVGRLLNLFVIFTSLQDHVRAPQI